MRVSQDPILRRDRRIFWILTLLACLVAVGGVIFVFAVWRTIPTAVGYHFDANGQFDLVGDKSIAFWHPFVAQAVILLVFSLLGALSFAIKPAKRLSLAGHRTVTIAVAHWCNLIVFLWITFFVYWEHCVARQNPLDTTVTRSLMCVLLASFGALVVIIAVAFVRCRAQVGCPKDAQGDHS